MIFGPVEARSSVAARLDMMFPSLEANSRYVIRHNTPKIALRYRQNVRGETPPSATTCLGGKNGFTTRVPPIRPEVPGRNRLCAMGFRSGSHTKQPDDADMDTSRNAGELPNPGWRAFG